VLVTGASSGIGAAIAGHLATSGACVYGTSRSSSARFPEGVRPLVLDVTHDASVQDGVELVARTEGRLDAIVNNAGVTLLGAIEETDSGEALALLDTNVLGVHRVTRAAMPHLRRARGHCLIVGSIAGFLSKPFEAFYCASKHALEAYAEVLRYEVEPFGVRVVLLEPGYIKTPLAANATSTRACLAEYQAARGAATALLQRDLQHGSAPARVAEMVARVLDDEQPPLRRLIGADARRLRFMRSILPDRWFNWGLRRRFGRQA
jgi:NAD(P)-dependent dehydrogenase (short-subunit alcohol dehydrogenase family)